MSEELKINAPKVSVIVPVYKVEKCLDRCMESLLNQTLYELEIILVDDGSPDNCGNLCEKYAATDGRIKVVHKENEGLGYARNSGMEVATGEYIGFVDSDDYVDVHMFEELYLKAKKDELDAVFGGYYFHSDKRKENIKRSEVTTEKLYVSSQGVQEYLLGMIGAEPSYPKDAHFTMSVWRGIYKREIAEKNSCRFPSERDVVSEDIIFHIQFLNYADKIEVLPKCYYYYCLNDQSLTHTYRKDRFDKVVRLIELITALFEKYGIKDADNLCRDRLLLARARGAIRSIYRNRHSLGLIETDKAVRKILDNTKLRDCISRYPWHSLPVTQRMFFLAMKYKSVLLLEGLICINDYRKAK